jgi:hypothetical protein
MELEEPLVSEDGLIQWIAFLQDDAQKNGGTASTFLRLKPEGRPVKVTCCSRVVIVEFLTDIEFAIEKATFFIAV